MYTKEGSECDGDNGGNGWLYFELIVFYYESNILLYFATNNEACLVANNEAVKKLE